MPVMWPLHPRHVTITCVVVFFCVVIGEGVNWSRFGDVEGTVGHGTTEITSVLIDTRERSGGWGKGGRGGGEKGEGNSVFWEKRMYIHVHALYVYKCMYVYMLHFFNRNYLIFMLCVVLILLYILMHHLTLSSGEVLNLMRVSHYNNTHVHCVHVLSSICMYKWIIIIPSLSLPPSL